MNRAQAEHPPESEQSLWQIWLARKAAATRYKLFFYGESVRILTGYLYRKYPHPLAEWGDYVNLASIGLLQAIDRFNPAINSNFNAYAEPYIKGSILKGLACYIRDKASPMQERLNSIRDSEDPDDEKDELERLASVAIGIAFGCFLELGIEGGEESQCREHCCAGGAAVRERTAGYSGALFSVFELCRDCRGDGG